MVGDDDILETVDRHQDDLDRATKSLVSAANRGGGEDNITVVAFRIADDGDATVQLPAQETGADDDTLEHAVPMPTVDTMVVPADQVPDVFVEPGSPEAAAVVRREPITPAARARLVLTMVVLLGIAAVLLVVGLTR
jgi:hypothetical protein